MAFNIFEIEFSELAKEITFRFDVDFVDFNRIENKTAYSFKDFFDIENFEKKERLKFIEEIGDNDFYYSEIGNVTKQGNVNPLKLNFNDRNELNENYFKKIEKGDIQKVVLNNILLAKVRPNLKKYLYIDDEKKKYFYTTAFINLKPKKLNKVFYYSFRTIFYKNLMAISRQGKGYPTLKEDDLYTLKFDKTIIKKLEEKQNVIIAKIEPIEKKIKELKSQIKQPQEIINKVFAREFGFDENLYNEFGKGMTAGTQMAQNKKLRVFETDFQDFSRSSIFRFSTRFHNPPTKELMDFMDNIKTLKVKDIIKTYEKGVQPIYNSDGEIPVIKIANLKNGHIDFSENEKVTRIYFDKLDDKKKLKKNDIIICATGKISLGKIDIFEDTQEAITTVDNYILRIDKNKYNPLFFTYFFRSILGFFQIERDYTGATNQIHLYWNQISELDIPDISLTEQKRIVNEIKTELDNQKEIEKEIEKERNKIDKIIEEVIK